jgi:diguanylate cyclase (GGDEF)-like protein/PAS domain S-box-containing protein
VPTPDRICRLSIRCTAGSAAFLAFRRGGGLQWYGPEGPAVPAGEIVEAVTRLLERADDDRTVFLEACTLLPDSTGGSPDAACSLLAAPLLGESLALRGALCVSAEPGRAWSLEEKRAVIDLAELASASLELPDALEHARVLEHEQSEKTAILESISDGFIALDSELRFTYVNRRTEILLKRTREEMTGRSAYEVFPSFRGSPFERRYREVLATRESVLFEAPSGAVPGRWLEVSAAPSGTGLSVYFRDITERLRVDRALRESEERYRTLFEESRDAIYFTSLDGQLQEGNQAMIELLGYEADELGLLNVQSVYAEPEDRERFRREIEARGSIRDFAVRLRTRSGAIRDCLLTATVRRAGDGEKIGYVGIIHDVTERASAEAALRASEERFRSLMENALDTTALVALDGTVHYVSPSVERVIGIRPEALVGRKGLDLVHPDDLQPVMSLLAEIVANPGSTATAEIRFRGEDGEWRLQEAIGKTFEAGSELVVVNFRDITERRAAEAALRESEVRFRLMVEGSEQVFFYVHDTEHRFTYLSPSVSAVLGYAADELLGRPFEETLDGEDATTEVVALTDDALLSGERPPPYTAAVRHRDGRKRFLEVVESPLIRGGVVVGMQGFARDVTDRYLAEEQLLHDALHDALTGLPNRTLLMDRLSHLIERSRRRPNEPYAVLFLDLDRFKVVNDSLGHLIGDRLLVGLADRLAGCLRPTDTIARMGGDEFTVLLEEIDGPSDACRVAVRFQEALRKPFRVDGYEVFTTGSIGIAVGTAEYQRPEHLLRDADIAMYRAKAEGRGRYKVFDATMHEEAMRLLELETDLRHAIDRGEFRLYYQPIVDIDTGRVTAFESLLRWEHPTRGLLRPREFVPTTEETGLIVPIGWWALRSSCEQLVAWKAGDPSRSHLRVCVNLSARQFVQPDLLERIDGILEATGLEGASLALEITESVIMENAQFAIGMLADLQARGIQLIIDDFGVGYSSLAYLQHFPVETLKIDRSFVSRLTAAGENTEIVRAILTLARDLGMEPIAEGVETEAQRDQLKLLGCRLAQGYLFAHPLPAAEAEALLPAPASA